MNSAHWKNRALSIALTLAFTSSIQPGPVAEAQNVVPGDEVVIEKAIGSEGGYLGKILYPDMSDRISGSGAAISVFEQEALKSETNVKFTISQENTTVYPDASFLNNLYPVDKLEYIGPLATLELPFAALNLESTEDKLLLSISPSFYEGALDRVQERDIRLELRVPLKDGDFVFHTLRFGYIGEAPIWSDFLKSSYGDDPPETVTISVQAVDVSRILPNPDDYLGPRNDPTSTPQKSTPKTPTRPAGRYQPVTAPVPGRRGQAPTARSAPPWPCG